MSYVTTVQYGDDQWTFDTDHDYGELYALSELGEFEMLEGCGVEWNPEDDLFFSVWSVPEDEHQFGGSD
jgi:hypothetical protein